jgi:glycerophosphoryl diester phosphodiesterase
VPTLTDAIAVMLPQQIPMIEFKAGSPAALVAELRRVGAASSCIVQSFDWRLVAEVGELAPEVALAVLGPNPVFATPCAAAITAALQLGAGLLHWRDRCLERGDVERVHAHQLLVCTYTTDDALGWHGGQALGIDAMCTNDPARMKALGAS